MDERVSEEMEALTAILMDEVTVSTSENGTTTVESVLFPSTAADEEQQFVTVTLTVELPAGYPDESPAIRLRNPRGLDDDLLAKILSEAKAKCEDYLGQPVIYELIELVREHLTSSNTPSCQCAICLYGFRDEDEFTKTPCFHHFHAHCLASYVRSHQEMQRQEKEKVPLWQRMQQKDAEHDCVVPCPVCRESLSCQLDRLSMAAPPKDVQDACNFKVTEELRALQSKMNSLYLYQQQKGGIIDPEADENKLLLVTQSSSNENSVESAPVAPVPTTPPQPATGFKPQAPGSRSWKRGGGGHPKAGGSSRGNRGNGRGRDRRNHQSTQMETTR
ncbi:E3 ubiquitin-protein ligase RNF25 isoform X2 [Neocloeon triangulifer]|uniref:E3 ubiquitin-protein ligase RNF25 isoform X2 n=1 Tax=Neocloeon triangulifer TaxID=2078957 RepID=UPI00286F0DAC|nr:E3 ubiquitin-protein ligase RNF25 isoform X2 [Neocloeon triangulifer]